MHLLRTCAVSLAQASIDHGDSARAATHRGQPACFIAMQVQGLVRACVRLPHFSELPVLGTLCIHVVLPIPMAHTQVAVHIRALRIWQ